MIVKNAFSLIGHSAVILLISFSSMSLFFIFSTLLDLVAFIMIKVSNSYILVSLRKIV
jgi:hypothetical protein